MGSQHTLDMASGDAVVIVIRAATLRVDREVTYDFEELDELMLSYGVTVHKSPGSEYPVVIIPIHTQHYALLQRNLLHTAITRGRKLVVLVGARKAIAIAVNRVDSRRRVTLLKERLCRPQPLYRSCTMPSAGL